MKDILLYIYYFLLILALALYTNMTASPNIVIRLGYLAALVLPLLKSVEMFPAIIICALGISKNTFAFPLMPTDMAYYIILALCFAYLALYRRDFVTGINPMIYIALVYVGINDIALQGEFSHMTTAMFTCIMFYICMEDDLDYGIQFLPLSFIIISLAISYWALFCPEAQINSYNKVGEMEQTGWIDPNYLSAVLGMGLVIAVVDLIKGGNRLFYTVFLYLTVSVSVLALLLLASRGAILSVTVAAVVLIVFSQAERWTKITVVVVAALFMLYLFTNQYMDFLMARFEADDGTAGNRTEIWQSKINDFFHIDNPLSWFFGVGQSEGAKLGKYLGSSGSMISTHNDFLSVLIYYGFLGVFLLLYMIAYPLRLCSKEDRPQIIALVVYLMMCSMTIEPMASGNFVYWGFLFYIMMYARHSQELELVYEEDEEENDDEEQD